MNNSCDLFSRQLGDAARRLHLVVLRLLFIAVAACAVPVNSSRAETLHEALASAYRSNPVLLGQRKAVEATDETVSRARSGFRPQVIANADIAHQQLRTNPPRAGDGSTRPRGYTIQLTQSIFQGFQTVNAVRQAEANVLAARATLLETEQTTLLNSVTAYMDVLRDRAIVRLRENNLRILTRTLRATRDRMAAGDANRTDVAQAVARRAGAVSTLDTTQANLRSSQAAYQQFIGHLPGRLTYPSPPGRNIPSAIQAATRQAMEENPAVVNAAFIERAAQHNIDQLTGQLLPTVNLEADYTSRFDSTAFINQTETATIIGRLNVPLYQGGGVYAQIREARRTRERLAQEIENQRRIARANLITAWSTRRAAIARLKSDRVQVQSNRTALAGVRAEESVGQRSILDVLDAVQELLDAQVALTTTKRDVVVAGYTVLSAVGRLTSSDLSLNIDLHDPETYYGLVRRKPWGTRVLRDEEYAGFVVTGWETEAERSSGLADDVSRIIGESTAWAVSEVRRSDDIGHWYGQTTIEGTEAYK